MINREKFFQQIKHGMTYNEFWNLLHDEHYMLRLTHIIRDGTEKPLYNFQLGYTYNFVQSLETFIERKELTPDMPIEEILCPSNFLHESGYNTEENLTVSEINTLYMFGYLLGSAMKTPQ